MVDAGAAAAAGQMRLEQPCGYPYLSQLEPMSLMEFSMDAAFEHLFFRTSASFVRLLIHSIARSEQGNSVRGFHPLPCRTATTTATTTAQY